MRAKRLSRFALVGPFFFNLCAALPRRSLEAATVRERRPIMKAPRNYFNARM